MQRLLSPNVTLNDIGNLEAEILKQGNEINSEDARMFHDRLISYYKEFTENDFGSWYNSYFGSVHEGCVTADFIVKKVFQLEKKLLPFFTPAYTIWPIDSHSQVNDQHAASAISALPALILKQKFYIQMIDSLDPTGNLNQKQAAVQSNHLDQYHKKFISNQSKITTLIGEDASFQEQVEISLNVQQKLLDIQTKLQEIISPTPTETIPAALALPTTSSTDKHLNQTEPPRVIVDFLDSLLKKQKHLIEQIELIESKNDPSAKEAETLHNHISQLHNAFVENQSKIETYYSGADLDEQLKISGEILQKVITLQTKLMEVIASVKSSSENVSSSNEAQPKLSDTVDYVDWLYERLLALEKEIEYFSKTSVRSTPGQMEQRHKWFILYYNKIKQLVAESPYDVRKLNLSSDKVKKMISEHRSLYDSKSDRFSLG